MSVAGKTKLGRNAKGLFEPTMKISYTVDINSTPEGVWYWIGTPERAAVWQTSVSKNEIVHETPDMIGTTFRETVEENGRGVEMHGVVTSYRENELLALHLDSKYHSVDVEYRLEEIENRTHLTQNATVRFKSFMKVVSILIGPVLKKKIMNQSQKEFAALKELCERSAPS